MRKLSGDEWKSLSLWTIITQNPNFLILYEPTNDFDIITLDVMENLLIDFPGSLLFVSHDWYFMDKIMNYLFVWQG